MAKPLVDALDQHVASRLKMLRLQRGVSAQALADAIDSTQQQISRYENGHNKLSATQLYRISEALGISISWFFQGFKEKNPVHRLAEDPASYELSLLKDELEAISSLWPALDFDQRASVLRLIEVMLKE